MTKKTISLEELKGVLRARVGSTMRWRVLLGLLFDAKVRNVRPRFIQADEAWTFVQKKQKRLKLEDPEERGDQYVWIALDSETKAVLSYRVGKRDAVSAYEFIGDLHERIAETHRCQLTTDGLEGYIPAVEEHFGADVDFAQLVKQYAHPRTDGPDWFRPSSHSWPRFRLPSAATQTSSGFPRRTLNALISQCVCTCDDSRA